MGRVIDIRQRRIPAGRKSVRAEIDDRTARRKNALRQRLQNTVEQTHETRGLAAEFLLQLRGIGQAAGEVSDRARVTSTVDGIFHKHGARGRRQRKELAAKSRRQAGAEDHAADRRRPHNKDKGRQPEKAEPDMEEVHARANPKARDFRL